MYWDEGKQEWSSEGVEVGEVKYTSGGSTSAVTCKTSHLTSFVLAALTKSVATSVKTSSSAKKSTNASPMALPLVSFSFIFFFALLGGGTLLDGRLARNRRVVFDEDLNQSKVVHSDKPNQWPLDIKQRRKFLLTERIKAQHSVLSILFNDGRNSSCVVRASLLFMHTILSMALCGMINADDLETAEVATMHVSDIIVAVISLWVAAFFVYLVRLAASLPLPAFCGTRSPQSSSLREKLWKFIPHLITFFLLILYFYWALVSTYSYSTVGNQIWAMRFVASLFTDLLILQQLIIYFTVSILWNRGGHPLGPKHPTLNRCFQVAIHLPEGHPAMEGAIVGTHKNVFANTKLDQKAGDGADFLSSKPASGAKAGKAKDNSSKGGKSKDNKNKNGADLLDAAFAISPRAKRAVKPLKPFQSEEELEEIEENGKEKGKDKGKEKGKEDKGSSGSQKNGEGKDKNKSSSTNKQDGKPNKAAAVAAGRSRRGHPSPSSSSSLSASTAASSSVSSPRSPSSVASSRSHRSSSHRLSNAL
eukprot:GILI01013028.1.p1 GENE.GILI01013028.1~~GILI01013028.1.p1  ORF type:complete len:532 (+),score=118.31 GILI01013028.1:250-1845(+)